MTPAAATLFALMGLMGVMCFVIAIVVHVS